MQFRMQEALWFVSMKEQRDRIPVMNSDFRHELWETIRTELYFLCNRNTGAL